MNITIDHPTNRPNFTELTLGDLTLWFSYQTLVAVKLDHVSTGRIPLGHTMIVRENDWGPTTAGHLAHIDGQTQEAQAARLPGDDFAAEAEAMIDKAQRLSLNV